MEGGLGSDLTVLVVSLAIIPAVLAFLLLCLKIRASRSNQEIYGVEGTVKKKNDEVLNISGSTDKHNLSADKHHLSIDDANIRTPSYDRKLPEIPDDIYKTSIKDDNSSELYATVDDNLTQNLIPQGAAAVSVDPSNHPYAKVKKQRKQEHPYAKVGETQNGKTELEDEDDETEYETTEKLETSGGEAGGANFSAWIPPPPRNPSRQATPLPPEPPVQQPAQQHFSGDSQDSTYSTKGYTSISVREPLENLRAAVPPSQPTIQEGNYVTLSETSDEMYAAIDDNVYMDPQGAHGPSRGKENVGEEEDLTTMYSKIDKSKKRLERRTAAYDGGYATVNKSRQSPERNFGARPKQRYSAIPFAANNNRERTEEVDYSGYEVSRVDEWNSRPTGEKRKIDPGYETVPYVQQGQAQPSFHRDLSAFPRHSFSRDPGYEVLPGDSKVSEPRDPDYETVPSGSQSREPGYETLPHRFRSDSFDPGYETLSKRSEGNGPRSYPEYTTTRYREYREPGYETVQDFRTKDPDYESVINNQGGNPSSEPGYETVPDRRQRPNGDGRMYAPDTPDSGRSKPRAAKAFKSPSTSPQLPPSGLGMNHIYRSSEPELNSTGPETSIGYETLSNEPSRKFSMDSEEGYGYETIPSDQSQNVGSNQSQRRESIQSHYRDTNQSQHRDSNQSHNRDAQHRVSNQLERKYSNQSQHRDAQHRVFSQLERRDSNQSHRKVSNHLERRDSNQSQYRDSNQPQHRVHSQLERRDSNQSHRKESSKLERKHSNQSERRDSDQLERRDSNQSRLRDSIQLHPNDLTQPQNTDSKSTHRSSETRLGGRELVEPSKVRRDATPHSRVVNQGRNTIDSEYEIFNNYDTSVATSTSRDLNNTEGSLVASNMKIRMNSEEINYIDEDVDSGPGTPGSPTIHMSVVDNGPGIRRASVVVIERFEEDLHDTSAESHIFV